MAEKKTKKKAKKKAAKAAGPGEPNANQKLFVELLLASHPRNQGKAYMGAYGGTNENAAWASASRLLRDAKVKAYLERREAEIFNVRFVPTQERIAAELSAVANARLSDFAKWDGKGGLSFKSLDQVPVELHGAIKSVQTEKTKDGEQRIKVWFHDKTKALELLGRHKKMFSDSLTLEAGDTLSQFLREMSGSTLGPPSMRKS